MREPAEIDESYPVVQGTLSPLHATKRAGDLYVQTYIDTYKLPLASFRLTGLYGPRQFGAEDHGWVANFAIKSVFGKPLTIFGTGKQVRDILYATDLVDAFEAFYKTKKAGIYNIGGSSMTAISLLECIKLMEDILGRKIKVNYEEVRYADLSYFVCDISKAKKNLGWQFKTSPREGITQLIKWIKDNKELFAVK
jgi:CDP-paratose 2-epimerase